MNSKMLQSWVGAAESSTHKDMLQEKVSVQQLLRLQDVFLESNGETHFNCWQDVKKAKIKCT